MPPRSWFVPDFSGAVDGMHAAEAGETKAGETGGG